MSENSLFGGIANELRSQGTKLVVAKTVAFVIALGNVIGVALWSRAEGLAASVYYVLGWVAFATTLVSAVTAINLWEWYIGRRIARVAASVSPDEFRLKLQNVQATLSTFRAGISDVADLVRSAKDDDAIKDIRNRYWPLHRATRVYIDRCEAGTVGASWPSRFRQKHALVVNAKPGNLSSKGFELRLHALSTVQHLESFEEELARFIDNPPSTQHP